MGKSSPKPPPAPDYAAAAQAQGAANLDAARLTARISNPNVSTPYGGQRVTFGKSVFDEAAYNKAMEDYNRQLQEYTAEQTQGLMPMDRDSTMYGYGPYSDQITLSGGRARPVAPTREQFTTTSDQDTPFIEQYLSPEQQKILEAQQRVDIGLAGLGETALGTAQRVIGQPFQPNLRDLQTELGGYGQVVGAPNLFGFGRAQAGVEAGGMPSLDMARYGEAGGGPGGGMFGLAGGRLGPLRQQTGIDTSGMAGVQYAPDLSRLGFARGEVPSERLQRNIDTSQLAAMPVSAGTTAQQAILSRLTPQLQGERQQLYTQLVNQGVMPGSEAFNSAMSAQSMKENDLVQQAALEGLRLDMAARQQGFGEAQAAAQFANQAALGQFGMGSEATSLYNAALGQNVSTALAQQEAQNIAQRQDFEQRVAAGEFGNAAQQALFGAGMQSQEARNAAIAQNFAQAQAAQGMQNQAIAQNQAAALDAYRALLAGQGQQFGQQMDVQAARNAALAQNQGISVQQQQLNNAAQLQRFNQALQGAQFGNTALQQSMQQQLALRNQPINEIAALMSGVQVNMPQFQGYQGANVAAAPIFAGTQAAGDFAQRNYANQVAKYNAQMGLLGDLGGAAATFLGGK
jgi:hypothetical protein